MHLVAFSSLSAFQRYKNRQKILRKLLDKFHDPSKKIYKKRASDKLKDVEIITENGGKIYYPYQFDITIMPHLENDGSENID